MLKINWRTCHPLPAMKMETSHHEDDKMMRVLYEASYEGCVSILNTLIQQDPTILHKINSTTIFTETPLHISALLGHLEFTKLLLSHKPRLALEFDSFRSTALHLASAEGHVDVVKELLQACDHACLLPDQQGRIPLHYAVIRGKTDVVLELISVKPESLWILDKGKTVFHLCVMYSHLEILKALMDFDIFDACMLLSLRDFDDNTVIDLAIMLKQVEIIRFLLSIPKIREAAVVENDQTDFTDHKKIFKSLHIQLMLMKSSIKNIQDFSKMGTPPPQTPQKGRWRKILKIMERNLKHNDNWLDEMRGNLSLVATVISTITFQAVNNPPGGFVQQDINSKVSDDPFSCLHLEDVNQTACPGDAVSGFYYTDYFHPYIKYNTIAFISSLTVVLILVSGVPLKHKAVVWMLSIAMCITLTFLTLTYMNGLYLVTPDGELFHTAWRMVRISLRIWIGFLGVAALLITWRFIMWLGKKKLKKLFKHIQIHPSIGNNENI